MILIPHDPGSISTEGKNSLFPMGGKMGGGGEKIVINSANNGKSRAFTK